MMSEVLVHEITLACSVDHAFDVFTSKVDLWWPKGHRRFASSTLRHDAVIGGQLIETATTGEEFILADVLACERPFSITLAWHPGKITAPTQTHITFQETGPHQAHVRVEHSEATAALGDQWDSRAALFNKGWQVVLAAMDHFITEGKADD
jgi:uncharacterized protein YndB with AHSA1/START domain